MTKQRQVVTFITVNNLSDIIEIQKNMAGYTEELNGKELVNAHFDKNITWNGIRLDMYFVTSFANAKYCNEFVEKLKSMPQFEHICCFLAKRQYAIMTSIFRFLNRFLYRPQPKLAIDEKKIADGIQKEQELWFTPEILDVSLKQNMDLPMCIVTFNRFREIAEYAGTHKVVSGYVAYKKRYANAVVMSALKRGMHPVYLSEELVLLYASPNHPLDQGWEDLQINEYRTRRDFFQLIQEDSYQNASVHRRAAVISSFVQCSTKKSSES